MKAQKNGKSFRFTVAGLVLAVGFSFTTEAYQGMPVRPLQVVGRHLKDDTGKIVMLHGWMQPSGWYWNGRAFPDPVEFTPEECAPALQVYKLQVEVLTRTNAVWGKSHGSYHTFVRFGESPGWDAVNNLQNAERFDRYINNLLVPYVDYCATRGIYVCYIGGASTTNWMSAQHKANLVEYFRRLASHPGLKNKPNVMFEICNEPVDIEAELGQGNWGSSTDAHDRAIQRYMQDITDAIRGTGATNVIWIPGLIWQARLQNFSRYPIAGGNIGYAGHWYPIGEDDPPDILNGFTNDWKKCSDVAPIIVTEGSWNTMASDQGLRTGTTAGFGKTQRLIRDTAENISWMAGMNGEVIGSVDWPPGGTNYTFPAIACGQAAFDWFPSYAWCKPYSGGAEVVLEQSLKIGDKLEVRSGQSGAQSFKYGPALGGPNFQVSKLRLFLSKSASAPTADLVVSLGTALNGGTIANSTVNLTPASVTDSSGGTTFMTYDVSFPTPIGPLAAGTTCYINFSSASANGYFVQMSSLADSHTGTVEDLYPRGAAFTNSVDIGKDVRFILSGADLPTAPLPPTGLSATSPGANQVKLSWVDSRIAAGYNVKRSTSSGGPYTTIATNLLSNNFTDTGRANGATYYYVVSAMNPFGESANSAQVSASPQAKLTGAVIGSPGSWGGGGNTIDKVFDGNLGTFYDAVNGSGDWAGLDLGAASVVTQIKYCPRGGYAGRMVGGQFQGANVADFSSGAVTLFTVTTPPSDGVLTVRAVSNPTTFRYLRYIGPANGFGNVAEVEFWSANTGTPPPAAPAGLTGTGSNWTAVMTWNASSGATSYRVKRSTSSGGPYTTIATNLVNNNFTDAGALNGTNYYYVVSAVNAGGESANSAEATVNPPFPWMSREIGSGGGGVYFSNGVFNVSGSGSDIWGNADAFRFVYVPVTGNCTVVARVASLQNVDSWSKAGVMIRASLDANAANAFIAVTPSNGVSFQYRSSAGGNSANNNTTGFSAPHWVRLVRSGNTFTGFRSANGVTWIQQGNSTTITMAATVYAGLAVTAHNNSALCTATFDNVTLPGWSNWTLPPVPAGLSGMADSGQATLTWISSASATSYSVKRSTTNGGPYTIAANVTATNHTDISLINGTTYYYVVSALNPAGESANSVQLALAPRPPMSLTLTETNLMLSWPLASAGFTVQSRTNLVLGQWENATSPAPEIVGDEWRVILPPTTNGAAFYRLVK
jgi:fibronectin type 3 domain-containing protein